MKILMPRLKWILTKWRQIPLPLARIKYLIALGGLAGVVVILYLGYKTFLSPSQPIANYTLPYVQNFDDVKLRRWFTNGGVWTTRQGTLLQTVGGDGIAHLHIPLKLPEDKPYHASIYITLKKDTRAAGISFNAQYPTLTQQQHRIYLYRPDKDTLQLIAGYMDSTGSFVPQAQIPLTPTTSEFRLDLFVYEKTYSAQLNGQNILEDRALFYHNGMVGFFAIASAIFDTLTITAADDRSPNQQVYTSDFDQKPGGAGWVPITGDWRITGGQLTQQDASFNEASIGYETLPFQNYVVQANFNLIQGAGAGVLFNMPSPYQINGAHMVRYSDETDALIWGYFDEKKVFVRQGFVNHSPPGNGNHQLQIYSKESSYDIFLDGQSISRDIPLQITSGHIGLLTANATAGYSLVEVFPLFDSSSGKSQLLTPAAVISPTLPPDIPTPTVKPVTAKPAASATPTPAPAANSTPVGPTPIVGVQNGSQAVYQSSFTGNFSQSGWKSNRGKWAFSDGNLTQSDPIEIDSHIVYTPTQYSNFSLTVSLSHLQGSAGGVLFAMPATDKLNGAYLVRYSERRQGAIFWGSYDNEGKFIGQGYADVPDASTDKHVFRIVSKGSSYNIYLDDALIVKNIPQDHAAGYIGLLTSQSSVAYDRVEVAGTEQAANQPSIVTLDAFSDVKILSGKWDTQSQVIRQLVTQPGDYILNSGIFAADYTLEAKITLPEGTDLGGGFIFHMPDRGSRKGASVVRLIDGGQGVFWGVFDENNQFKGKQSAKISPAQSYVLKLVSHAGKMDIFVNDQAVFQDVLLDRQDGWLGLIAHGGVIQFENIRVSVTNEDPLPSGGN